MTVDEAVTLRVQRILLNEGCITKREAREIAREVAESVKDEFAGDFADIAKEINNIRDRTDRLWDASLKVPDIPSWWTKMWRRILRKNK